MQYRLRIADQMLRERLAAVPMVVVEGPRAVGKTETARQHARSEVLFDVDANALAAAEIDPAGVLEGPEPRLLDEWQLAPMIWNHARRASDDGRRPGRFILTGSAVPSDDTTRHSGIGRVSRIRLRPMSLFESGESSGATSLAALADAQPVATAAADEELVDVIGMMCRGGWPGILDAPAAEAQRFGRDYVEEASRTSVPGDDERQHDPIRVRRLLTSLGRNVATEASVATLCADTSGDAPLSPETVSAYLRTLGRLYVVEDQPAWSIRLQSRARLRKAPKRHFACPSLAVAALEVDERRVRSDLQYCGLLFESLAVRDLRAYADPLGGTVFHYRDSNDLEVDAVIEMRNGDWMAFEVKLGGQAAIEHAAASLHKLADTVASDAAGPPRALGIITATGYGYQRPDDIAVIPITTLGP